MPDLDVDVILLPRDLTPAHLDGRAVVVFDVLRATTSMTAALAAGVRELRIFGDVEAAAADARVFGSTRLLCGEVNCLAPPGFDLGNSPGAFRRDLHADRVAFLSTTNGTKAIIAAQSAAAVLAGAVVNARAVATKLGELGLPVTLLCAGTGGHVALEDILGCGAVIDRMIPRGVRLAGDTATLALKLFNGSRDRLAEVMREATGGRNLIRAGLESDIDFCATVDRFPLVGEVHLNPLRVTLG